MERLEAEERKLEGAIEGLSAKIHELNENEKAKQLRIASLAARKSKR